MNLNIFAFGRNCVPKFEDKTVDRNVFGRNGDSLGKFILLRYNQLFIFHTYFRFGNDNTFVPFCYLPFVASYLFVTYLLLLRTFLLSCHLSSQHTIGCMSRPFVAFGISKLVFTFRKNPLHMYVPTQSLQAVLNLRCSFLSFWKPSHSNAEE
jgi:hypothetical protein